MLQIVVESFGQGRIPHRAGLLWEFIEKRYEKFGVSKKTAAARAWATVNRSSGGGKKSAEK